MSDEVAELPSGRRPDAGLCRCLPLSTESHPKDGLADACVLGPPRLPGRLGGMGEYDVLRRLGAGGMGIVYEACRLPSPTAPAPDGRRAAGGEEGPVALKVLRRHLASDPRLVRLFLREAERLQGLNHPGIIQVIEIGAESPEPYFVMPYLPRGSLALALEPGKPADPALIARIAAGVGAALKHIHDKGLVHGDVKPSNILLDAQGEPVLADLGLARHVSNDTWVDLKSRRPDGTLVYMAPEVVAGHHGDARRDIYALGVVLYQMLTGELPYEGETPAELERKIREGPLTPILTLNPQAPAGLVALAERAMARELADRYADMSYLMDDLKRVAANPTAPLPRTLGAGLASAGSRPAEARSPAWRRRGFALAVALLGLLVLFASRTNRGDRVPRERYPNRLRPVWTNGLPGAETWAYTLVGDYLGDGSPALYRVAEDRLVVLSPANPEIPHLNKKLLVPDGVTPHLDALVEGRSRSPDAVVTWRDSSNFVIGVFNANGSTVGREFRVPAQPWPEPPGKQAQAVKYAAFQAILTNTPDGQPRLLAAINAGWEGNPRGIYCWTNIPSAPQWEWKHEVAGWVSRVLVGDLNADGTNKLVYALSAVGTTNRVGDTDDDHAYIGVLDTQGRRLRQWVVGGRSNWVDIALGDLDGSGKPAIVAGVSLNERTNVVGPRSGLGRVLCYNEQGTELARFDLDAELVHLKVADVDGDRRGEVIATDRLGQVYLIESNFRDYKKRLVTTNAFSFVWLYCDAVADLDDDGQAELVFRGTQVHWIAGTNPGWEREDPNRVQYRNNSVLILNADLEPLAAPFVLAESWDDMPRFSSTFWRGKGQTPPSLIVLGDRAVGLTCERTRP